MQTTPLVGNTVVMRTRTTSARTPVPVAAPVFQREGTDYKYEKTEDDKDAVEGGDILTDLEPTDLDEDTYGMAACSLIRDSYHLFIPGDKTKFVRATRFATSLAILFATIASQIFVMYCVKVRVCAQSVHDIRESYGQYEEKIYGKENCTWTSHGECRGITDYRVWPGVPLAKERLNAWAAEGDDAEEAVFSVCRISLSQPIFIGVILILWTLTCVIQMRNLWNLFYNLILDMPSVPSMQHAVERGDEDHEYLIIGITCHMKVVLVVCLFIPCAGIAIFLLWVGCRWLLATESFSDLVLNAVALEFILLLKDNFYMALVPNRSRLELGHTKLKPSTSKTDLRSYCQFLSTLWWFAATVIFVISYMVGWQQVLPQYQWDVHEVCEDFIAKRFAT